MSPLDLFLYVFAAIGALVLAPVILPLAIALVGGFILGSLFAVVWLIDAYDRAKEYIERARK